MRVTFTSEPGRRGPRWSVALRVVFAGALLRLVLGALLPLFPDEAYYWEWSRHLAPGYFDHPPLIALVIKLGGVLLGPFGAGATPIAVRLGPILAGLVASITTIEIARRLAGDAAAVRAAVAITVLPLAAAGLVIATPDAPLLMMTAIGCYAVVRALECALRSPESLIWWLVAGAALGLAFTSKYTSILLPAGVFLALLTRASLRYRLREPGPYLAAVVATIVFAPVLIWNAQHEWISFTYQLRHGLTNSAGSVVMDMLRREGEYIGGQAALASPILFVLMAIAVRRGLSRRSSDAQYILGLIALVSFGLFAYSALRRPVEPNWPAPGYIPAIVLLATMQRPADTRFKKWYRAGVGVAIAMSALIYVQGIVPVLPVAPPRDPVARAFGWREATLRVDSVMRAATAETGAPSWAGGDRYQEASELAVHDSLHRRTFATNLSGRPNQYDLWPGFPALAKQGDNLVLVLDDTPDQHPTAAALAPFFQEARRGELVTLRRGEGRVGIRRIWILLRWKGDWPKRL